MTRSGMLHLPRKTLYMILFAIIYSASLNLVFQNIYPTLCRAREAHMLYYHLNFRDFQLTSSNIWVSYTRN